MDTTTQRAFERWSPALCGLLTVLAVAWMWDGLAQPGTYHDERAYLVQARLLALGSWTAPAPPLPIFWAMPHVFVEPAIFAKYPPGFAPLLVPGVWLGLPGLGPALFAGVAAALMVMLVRRLAGTGIAIGAWLIWTTAAKAMSWHASYFSETLTVPLYLGGLLALHSWLEHPRRSALLALVACVGWLGITRPVTGLALATPIAVVVIARAIRSRSLDGWRPAVVLGLSICALVPYWAWRTLGSPAQMPYSEYSREYFPWDLPGFTRDTSSPRQQLSPDLQALAAATGADYVGHTASKIPGYLVERSVTFAKHAIGQRLAVLAALAPIGFAMLGAPTMLFVGGTFLLMFLAYTTMPHEPDWSLYYLELFPFVAAGVAIAAGRVPMRYRCGAILVVIAIAAVNLTDWRLQRYFKTVTGARQRLTPLLVSELEDPRAVIFVRREPHLSPHFTVWDILGPPELTPTWIVRDLGPEADHELLRYANGRRPYYLDEASMTLTAWDEVMPAIEKVEPPRNP